MSKIKALAIIVSFCFIVVSLTGCKGAKGEMRDITTMELVRSMGLGINLGNTFESTGFSGSTVQSYETGWGSPTVTQEMIKGYADSGFGVLRIPVAWSNMMTGNYDINPDYMARVKQVADWALESGMYVIINIHWDNGWFAKFSGENKDECMYKYERIWTQITDEFKNYSDYLMFESLNEEGCWEDIWNRYSNEGDKEKAFGLLNEINQHFVNLVRASGGNNEKRHLLIAGYGTDFELTCDELYKMPDDPQNRCAVSVHYYTPSTFAILDKDASWGKARKEWGSEADYAELEKYMDMVKERFIDNGIPVIIGEYGSATKNKEPGMVKKYLTAVCEAGYTRGMCPVLWDITNVFYDRINYEFIDKEMLADLMKVKELERAK